MDAMPPTARRWVPLAGVAVLFAAVVTAATLSSTEVTRLPDTVRERERRVDQIPAAPMMPTGPTGLPGDAEGILPPWLSTLLAVLCIGMVVVVIGLLVWFWLKDRLIHRRPGRLLAEESVPVTANQREGMRAAIDEGLADLDDADTDPRRAVIACWVRLELAAAAAGTAREVGDTSTELVTRLLTGHQVTAPVLAGLAAVYREARYATHTVDGQMRDQARAALRQLRDELALPPLRPTVDSLGETS